MNVVEIKYQNEIKIENDYVIAIGNFDGIHVGHREVIKKARSIAKDKNLKLGVLTFNVTPRKVVNEIDNYYVLRSLSQKKEILKELDVDTLFIINFDNKMRSLSANDFINDILLKCNVKYLVCGFDFSFGLNKQGDVTLLQKYQTFNTVVLPRFEFNDDKVGSTMIHELILHGNIESANKLLVKPYSITGIVIKGNQRGQEIGFPTANLMPSSNYRIPEIGVYATQVIVDGKKYFAMTNIGHNPTFNYCSTTSIETNIFDFKEDIYGKEIEVIFYKNIRKEKIFRNIEGLVAQLNIDKKEIVDYFNTVNDLW